MVDIDSVDVIAGLAALVQSMRCRGREIAFPVRTAPQSVVVLVDTDAGIDSLLPWWSVTSRSLCREQA